jgi:type III pantothenate kinase
MTSPDTSIPRRYTVLDIGNSRIALGNWENAVVSDTVRIDAADRDGFTAALRTLREKLGTQTPALTGVASVVPDALAWIRPAVLKLTGREALVIGDSIPLPIPVQVRQPERVGVDRVCAAAAAFRRVHAACTVVQFGSAITVDVVSDDGAFLGGAILPGVTMQARALNQFTAGLPLVSVWGAGVPPLTEGFGSPRSRVPPVRDGVSRPGPVGESGAGSPECIGRDTEEAIRSGITYGTAGAIRGLVESIATQLGKWPQVIATGGDVLRMAEHCDFLDSIVPDLTLMGIGDCLDDRFASQSDEP